MELSATIGYGIAVSRSEVVKAGFMRLDILADEIADRMPYMTRISTGDFDVEEQTLIMAISNTVITTHDFSQSFGSLKDANKDFVRELDRFMAEFFPGKFSGIVLSAAAQNTRVRVVA